MFATPINIPSFPRFDKKRINANIQQLSVQIENYLHSFILTEKGLKKCDKIIGDYRNYLLRIYPNHDLKEFMDNLDKIGKLLNSIPEEKAIVFDDAKSEIINNNMTKSEFQLPIEILVKIIQELNFLQKIKCRKVCVFWKDAAELSYVEEKYIFLNKNQPNKLIVNLMGYIKPPTLNVVLQRLKTELEIRKEKSLQSQYRKKGYCSLV